MTTPKNSIHSPTQGFTLLELLVITAILGILFGLGIYSFSNLRNPARDTARTVHSAMFQLRSSAVTNTQARRMVLIDSKTLSLQSALSCAETDQSKWTEYGTVELPSPMNSKPVTLTNDVTPTPTPNVIVCFTPRGQASAAGSLKITDTRATYTVKVALAGGVQTSAL